MGDEWSVVGNFNAAFSLLGRGLYKVRARRGGGGWVLAVVVGLANVGGVCHAGRVRAITLRGMGLRIGGKRFLDVVKPSNYKGSALLGVVNLLSTPADNAVRVTNAGISNVGSGRLTTFHGRGLNFIFRSFRLVGSLGILSGIRLPLLCEGISTGRHHRLTRRMLGGINLDRHVHRVPARLSNNRYRHMTVTHTVVNGPRVVLTSRPANGLSSGVNTRIVRLLRRLGGRSKHAVIVIARGRRRTGRASHAIHFFSKHRIRWLLLGDRLSAVGCRLSVGRVRAMERTFAVLGRGPLLDAVSVLNATFTVAVVVTVIVA